MIRELVGSLTLMAWMASGEARVPRYSTTAPYVALVNVKTGGIVYEKGGDVQCDPASAMKIATAGTILEGGYDLDQRLTARGDLVGVYSGQQRLKVIERIPHALERNGTHMSIAAGEVLSVRDMLHGLIMISANDAANIMADGLEGSVEEFMRKVGLFVEQAGCTGTQFVNPHGLHHPAHYSTAKDMARIMRRCLAQPLFREMVSKKFYRVAPTNKSPERLMAPSNRLVKKSKWSYGKSLGGKTGQCFVARGKNLVSASADRGMELTIAVMDCKTYDECYEQTIRLSEIAFARGSEKRQFLKAGFQPFKKRLKGASQELETWTRRPVEIEVFRGEVLDVKKQVIWQKIQLPIQKGDVVGRVSIFNNQGELLVSEPLLARENIQADLLHKLATSSSAMWSVVSAHSNGPGLAVMAVVALGGLARFARR